MDSDSITVERVGALGGIDLVAARFRSLSTPRHAHDDLEIGVFAAGGRVVRSRAGDQLASADTILVVPPGEPHCGAPRVEGEVTAYRSFLIPEATLGRITGGRSVGPAVRLLSDPGTAHELNRVHDVLSAGPDRGAETVLRLLLTRVCDALGGSAGPDPAEREAVRRVRAHLDARYASKVRLETLAGIAGMSVFHLSRVFRAATGVPPYAYLEQVRVNRATEMLRQGHPLSRVAYLTGFADQSHLTRLFKRLVGVPPGRYQRSVRAGSGRARVSVLTPGP